MSKGRPYPEDVQAEVEAAHRENREIVAEIGLQLHEKQNPVKVMREFCIECMGGSPYEPARCTSVGCPLWPYRKGKNPFRTQSAYVGKPFGSNKKEE